MELFLGRLIWSTVAWERTASTLGGSSELCLPLAAPIRVREKAEARLVSAAPVALVALGLFKDLGEGNARRGVHEGIVRNQRGVGAHHPALLYTSSERV